MFDTLALIWLIFFLNWLIAATLFNSLRKTEKDFVLNEKLTD